MMAPEDGAADHHGHIDAIIKPEDAHLLTQDAP
jgi:hypothetical protein